MKDPNAVAAEANEGKNPKLEATNREFRSLNPKLNPEP